MWAVPTLYYKHALSGLVASATTSGFPVANILDRLERTWWKGVGTGTHTITFDAGVNKKIGCDYIGIANHNLSGATLEFQYSNDNFTADINDLLLSAIDSFATSAVSMQGIAVDPDGTLWEASSTTNLLYNRKKDGTAITTLPTSATAVRGIAVDPDGTLWEVSVTTNLIYHKNRDGTAIDSFATPAVGVQGIAVDTDDTLWVCTISTIYHIKKDGTAIDSFPTSAGQARGIAVDPDGTLWEADAVTNLLYNIKKDGTAITTLPTSATDVRDIAVDPDGTLWEVDIVTDLTYHINRPFPIGNKAFVKEFDIVSSRYWRIRLTNLTSVPFIGIAYWGQKVEINYVTASFNPHDEEEEANINESLTGVLLGVHERFTRRPIKIMHRASDDLDYQKIKAYKDEVKLLNFFLAWDKTEHYADVWLMRFKQKTFKAPFTKGGLYRDISYELIGRKEE